LAFDADTYVSPFIAVSTKVAAESPPPGAVVCCDWRIINVYVNVSSSSLLIFNRKFGTPAAGNGSGSYNRKSVLSKAGSMRIIISYLHIFYEVIVSRFMARGNLRGWEGIWHDVGDYAALRVCHCE
jgi:hypothetical protein